MNLTNIDNVYNQVSEMMTNDESDIVTVSYPLEDIRIGVLAATIDNYDEHINIVKKIKITPDEDSYQLELITVDLLDLASNPMANVADVLEYNYMKLLNCIFEKYMSEIHYKIYNSYCTPVNVVLKSDQISNQTMFTDVYGIMALNLSVYGFKITQEPDFKLSVEVIL